MIKLHRIININGYRVAITYNKPVTQKAIRPFAAAVSDIKKPEMSLTVSGKSRRLAGTGINLRIQSLCGN